MNLDQTTFIPRINPRRGHFVLHGVRGSTPAVGGAFIRHGGNTSCLAVYHGDDLTIFDAGSGIRDLGNLLSQKSPRKIDLFITHTHWDHIQGFPFFAPAYLEGFEINVYGSPAFGKDLGSIIQGQLDQEYFPMQMDDMSATFNFQKLQGESIEVGECSVTWHKAFHPGMTVGYKILVGNKRLAWIPDNEFLKGWVGDPKRLTLDHPDVEPYRSFIDFISDVDVLIHEAQYTNEEYPTKIGWGHSCLSNACAMIKLAGVKQWIVTHHDPSHTDAFLEVKLGITKQILEELEHDCNVLHGYEGMTAFL